MEMRLRYLIGLLSARADESIISNRCCINIDFVKSSIA